MDFIFFFFFLLFRSALFYSKVGTFCFVVKSQDKRAPKPSCVLDLNPPKRHDTRVAQRALKFDYEFWAF